MRRLADYLALACMTVMMVSCGALRKTSRQVTPDAKETILTGLCMEPASRTVTSDVKLKVAGRSLNGQLRMRYGRCIHLSVSLLGMELGRIEMFPDHVMIMDRSGSRYLECHYADLPYRNSLALDYSTIEAVLWNRLFSPGRETAGDIRSVMVCGESFADGTFQIIDTDNGNVFTADSKGHMTGLAKKGTGWHFNVGYSRYLELENGFEFPSSMSFNLGFADSRRASVQLEMDLTGLSVAEGTWKDQTQPTKRMRSITMDGLLDIFDSLGL